MRADVAPAMTNIVPGSHRHSADLRLRIGKHGRFGARIEIGTAGLLAIGGLVSSILLSSAVIVAAAKRAPDRT